MPTDDSTSNNSKRLDQQFLDIKEQKTAQREDESSMPPLPPIHRLYIASQAQQQQQLNPFVQMCYMRSAPIDNYHHHHHPSASVNTFIPSQLYVSQFSSEQVATKPVFIPYRGDNSKEK
jgi:hypothetical protein